MKKSLILILSLSLELGFSQLTSSLVACYPLDCDSAADMTSNGFNGTINGSGVTCATGHLGASSTAYHFAGTASDYIALPANAAFQTNAVCVSGWYESDDLGQAYLVYTKNNCSYNFEAYALNFLAPGTLGPGTGGFYVTKSGPGCTRVQLFQDLSVDPVPNKYDWTHVVFCIDDHNIYMYINGHLNNSMSHSISWDFASPMKGVILGNTNESNYTQSFKGSMDNLRFYSRCLTGSEVSLLYKRDPGCSNEDKVNESGSTVGLVHYGFGNLNILSQNVPNPFSNETIINYSMPASVTKASIDVYDMVGKKIASYPLSKGETSITISSTDLAAGMYVYSITGDGKVLESRRMVMTNK